MTTSEILSLKKKCETYLHDCLVFWADIGFDQDNRNYHEAVSLDGKPLTELNRRLRVQARNIFAHSAGTADGYGNFVKPAEEAFSFVKKYYWGEKGGAALCDPQGNIRDKRVFAYDHAFMLLAIAWLYSVTGKIEHRQGLDDIWEIFQTHLRNAKGGIFTSLPSPTLGEPMIEQNPHMHLFEALLDTYVLTKEVSWLKEAEKIYFLYQDYFYSPKEGLIREFFLEDYSPFREKEWVDPGHHYEWTWLLHKYQKLSGKEPISIPEIFSYAESRGRGKWGLAYEFCLPDNTVVKSTHRMWPQTEQIKARLAMYERTGKTDYLNAAAESVETLFRIFCHPKIAGVWYDCFDDEGRRISTQSPASTLYHLYVGLQEFIRVAGNLS